MFGSVFKMKPKPGANDDLMRLLDEETRERPMVKGMRATFVFDGGDNELWGVAVFDDEKTYRDNAASLDQDRWYRRMRDLLAANPEWHDGSIRAWVPQEAGR